MVINLPTNADAATVKTANLVTGDILVREKDLIIKHYAVFSHYDGNDVPILAENQPETGTAYVSLDKFLAGGKLLEIKKFSGDTNFVKQQLDKLVGKREYSLHSYNCEHFVNEVTIQKVKSEQVDFTEKVLFGLLVLLIAVGAVFAFRKLARA